MCKCPFRPWRPGLHCRLPLLVLLICASGCRERPVACKAQKYVRLVNDAEQGPTGAPLRADHLGPEVRPRDLQLKPVRLTFADDRHARVDWLSFDLVTSTKVVYSAGEEMARDSKDPTVFSPMKRFSEGTSERVWLAFRSPICSDTEVPGKAPCREFGEPALLVAEMSCTR